MRWGRAVFTAVAALMLAGCDRPDPPSDPELRAELGIADDVTLHRVMITGTADLTRLIPAYLEVDPGDMVQFRVRDRRIHQLVFSSDELADDATDFLTGTGQLSPPPLTAPEARLVLSFEGAPPGLYPYRIDGYAPSVVGQIRVRTP